MRETIRDLKFGLRLLAKEPGFTAVAAVTLALGIGANTAIFSVMNAVLLRPLPVREPGELLGLYRKIPEDPSYNRFSYSNYLVDPVTFTATPAILAAVGLAACLIPALRATRIDPLSALRYE